MVGALTRMGALRKDSTTCCVRVRACCLFAPKGLHLHAQARRRTSEAATCRTTPRCPPRCTTGTTSSCAEPRVALPCHGAACRAGPQFMRLLRIRVGILVRSDAQVCGSTSMATQRVSFRARIPTLKSAQPLWFKNLHEHEPLPRRYCDGGSFSGSNATSTVVSARRCIFKNRNHTRGPRSLRSHSTIRVRSSCPCAIFVPWYTCR